MTTGAPIYLVSACTSGEEFVAAFRRYADRNGLFIPIADPIPAGKKGRFAVTLKDGGVMVEGEAEVVSSARTPSVLHGRVGMTLRFQDPDEQSKTVLIELEKARLAMKPPPPSVPPRPANVPAEPRPVPPSPMGRIDANNALAECVAIGDVERLDAAAPPPLKAGPKFVVPSIPPVAGAPRPRPLSTPPIGVLATPPPSTPPAIPEKKVTQTQPSAVVPPPTPVRAATPPPVPKAPTPARPVPVATLPAPPIVAEVKPSLPEVEISGEPTDLNEIPTVQEDALEAVAEQVNDDEALVQARRDKPDVLQTMRGRPPSEDLLMTRRDPPSRQAELAAAAEEVLQARLAREPRVPKRTSLGVAVSPPGVTVLPAMPSAPIGTDDNGPDTALMPAQKPAVGFGSGQVDALAPTLLPSSLKPNVEESTPSGDWTITPGASGPTIVPRAPEAKAAPAIDPPLPDPGPPTGDWTIARVEDAPDGWSEPSKIEKIKHRPTPQPGPPMSVVTSTEPLESKPSKEPGDASSSEPKVQIDPTLIEPLTPMPNLDEPSTSAAAYSMPGGRLPTPPPGSVPGSYFTPPPGSYQPNPAYAMQPPMPMAYASTQMPPPRFGDVPRYGDAQPTAVLDVARRKRMIVIAASAGLAVVLGIVLLVVLTRGKTEQAAMQPDRGSQVVTQPAPDAGVSIAVSPPVDAAAEAPPPVDAAIAVAPPPTECAVDVVTVPAGAEIFLDKDEARGTTPSKLTLACGVEVRVTLKKSRYSTASRTITPGEKMKRLKVTLQKPTFSVKVSSSPPGGTVTAGRRSLGVTPTTVKLPAFEPATLVITKEGFSPESQKITPKSNNSTVHVTLKKKARGR